MNRKLQPIKKIGNISCEEISSNLLISHIILKIEVHVSRR